MPDVESPSHNAAVMGGGEMGRLIRDHDWQATPFGDPASWPQSLRMALSMCVNSQAVSAIYWGPEFRVLYNDAYQPFLGARHPWALGRSMSEVWPTLWQELSAPAGQVFETGLGVVAENQRLVLDGDGTTVETFWYYSFAPIFDESGQVAGVYLTAFDTTGRVLAERRIASEEDRLARMFEQAPGFITILKGPEHVFDFVNATYRQVFGNRDFLGRTAREVFPDLAGQGFFELLDQVYKTGERFVARHVPVRLSPSKGDEQRERVLDFIYEPVTDEAGQVTGIFCEGYDVTVTQRAEAVLVERDERQAFLLKLSDVLRPLNRIPDIVAESRRVLRDHLQADEVHLEELETAGEHAPGTHKTSDRSGRFRITDFLTIETECRSGNNFVVTNIPADQLTGDGEKAALAKLGIVALAVVPLLGDARLKAVMAAQFDEPHEWGSNEIALIEETAERAWGAMERARAEASLRESADRLSFLDMLNAETAALSDAKQILQTTTRLLGEHLSLSVCAYADMDEDQDGFTIRGDWAAPGATSIVGHYSLAGFGKLAVSNLSAGLPLVVNDNLRELEPAEAATFRNIGIASTICMPLIKEGRLTALMAIHDRAPRTWTAAELTLLREVTTRSWAHVERVGTLAELRESEERYRTLFNSIHSGFCVVEVKTHSTDQRIDYRVVEANPAFYQQTGFPEAIIGGWLREASPALEEHWFEAYARVASTGVSERFEAGSAMLGRWFDVYAFRVGEPEDARVGILFNDISARREMELALRRSEEQFRAFAQAVPNHVWAADSDGALYWFNDQIFAYCGETFESLKGAEWVRVVHPDDRPRAAADWASALAAGQVYETEFRIRRSDGTYRWFLVRAEPVRGSDGAILTWVGTNTDIDDRRSAEAELRDLNATLEQRVAQRTTELESAQEQLRQSQKLEAMGQLTGGVAHDFNNLLSPIIASLDILLRRGVGSERERRLMGGALQSAERAKTLVQRLLAFARRQPLQAGPVDVKLLVSGIAELIASTSGPRIEIRLELPDDLPLAVADTNQLEMALLNLAVNARDAMPEGGALTISASSRPVRGRHPAKLRQGPYVCLSITDTGIGMDEATLKRAVEPFFSTKGVGKGTGLGLSMVHGLVSQLNGGLTIASQPDLGTTIELWLPVSEEAVEEDDKTPTAATAPQALGTALLVDDEDLVRMSTADMLLDLGYQVVEAASAEEAIRLIDEGLEPDLLVTDHLMPGLTGAELAQILKSRHPKLPVLIVSGFAEEDGIEPGLARLTKPFRNVELAASLAGLVPR